MAEALINGIAYSWSQITLSIGQTEVIGISGITYDDVEEKENNYGQGKLPVSRARGKVTFEGSITLHMVEIEALQAIAPNGRIQDLAPFDILVAWLPEGGVIVKHKLLVCEFVNNGRDISQGDMLIEKELELIIGNINFVA